MSGIAVLIQRRVRFVLLSIRRTTPEVTHTRHTAARPNLKQLLTTKIEAVALNRTLGQN